MKFLILGFSLSGEAVYKFLKERKEEIEIYDDFKLDQNLPFISKEKVLTTKYDYIVRSPGFSALNPLYQELKNNKANLISEIELALFYLPKDVKIIGVSGSNGKTTTASLLNHILSLKYKTFLAGNIGRPLISIVNEVKPGAYIILELSSFQLEEAKYLHLNYALLLNMSPNHLDSVPSLDFYYNSKLNIISNQNHHDYFLTNLKSKVIRKYLAKKFRRSKLIDISKIKVKFKSQLNGKHNQENIRFAYALALILGINKKEFSQRLLSFIPLEHRQEFVCKYKGYTFINDSKSTSISATMAALKNYPKNAILIIGGKDKGLDYHYFEKYKNVYVYGQIKDQVKAKSFETLDEVIEDIFKNLKGKKTVLFSPACSSFDQYSNYEERGRHFKQLVREYLKNEENL